MKKTTIRKRRVRLDHEFNHGEYAALKVCAGRMDKSVQEFLRYLLNVEIKLAIHEYREYGEMEMNDEERNEFYKEHGEPDWAYDIDPHVLPH